MKSKKILLLCALCCSIFSACQKEISEEIPDTPNPTLPTSDSTYLDKIYLIQNSGSINDTFGKITVTYDNLKRVISLVDSIPGQNLWRVWAVNTFHYNADDTLPYKDVYYDFESAIAFNNPLLVDTITTFHTYNSSGKNIVDSTISKFTNDTYSSKEIKTYQYNAAKIYGQISTTILTGNYPFQTLPPTLRDSAITDGFGNILNCKTYIVNNNSTTLNLSSTFTYDSNPNPIARLTNFRTLGVLPFGETFEDIRQSKNNRLIAIETDSNNQITTEDLTGKYVYRADGYPLKLTQDYLPTGDLLITIFTYKKL